MKNFKKNNILGNKEEKKKLKSLGAFEVSAEMLNLAKKNKHHRIFFDAGRGNPNWINALARKAFCRMMEFGIEESQRTINYGDLAGYVQLGKIGKHFDVFLNEDDETDEFLREAISYCVHELHLDRDILIKELTDAVIGNNYPNPSRCLVCTEKILNLFLEKILYNGKKLSDTTDVFPTEGGTAAICYIFDSLQRNGLLKKGDKIVVNTPVFTPYIQIPNLVKYQFEKIDLVAKEENDWHIPIESFDILLDPEVKAFFLVNPSNPGARALNEQELKRIKEICEKRPDLMIITDDVYGTFVNDFQTVYSVVPYNTLLVYSYSKLYGATGWRVGLIALNEKNVFDHLIKKLPEETKKVLDKTYEIVTVEPRKMKFIERLAADSRSIGLYHTSGLSTPQQAMMAMFSLTHLLAKEEDEYIETCKYIVSKRYHDLFDTLGMKENKERTNSKYYSLIDIYSFAEFRYNKEFSEWLRAQFEEIDFLFNLAKEEGVVLMEGLGFDTTPGNVRVSQANLPDSAYKTIAKRIIKLMDEYYDCYKKEQNCDK